MANEGTLIVRVATKEDLKAINHLVVLQNWHFSPHDLTCVQEFDSRALFVGELNGEIIGHINAVKYAGHSTCIGTFVVRKELRGKGFGKQIWNAAWKSLDQSCTITLIGAPHMVSMYESFGFRCAWNTSAAQIELNNVVKVLSNISIPNGVLCKPIQDDFDLQKLFDYDTEVFGTSRQKLLEKYINVPESLGWAAVNEKGDILGYTVVKEVFGGTTEDAMPGFSMTPLYADNDIVARMLMKVAAETYLEKECMTNSPCFEIYYSDGGDFGNHALKLFKEVEVKNFFQGKRMYTKGVPPEQRNTSIYGLFSIAFD